MSSVGKGGLMVNCLDSGLGTLKPIQVKSWWTVISIRKTKVFSRQVGQMISRPPTEWNYMSLISRVDMNSSSRVSPVRFPQMVIKSRWFNRKIWQRISERSYLSVTTDLQI